MNLTDTQKRMMDVLKANGGKVVGTANLGFLMWPEPRDNRRHDTRSPQGMALAAGRIARQLVDAGLIAWHGHPSEFYILKQKV